MTGAWSREEIEAIVSDYLDMLSAELKGDSYNKSAHRRYLSELLSSRSDGSIERKHQNISAILIELGSPYISGYKPLANYQKALRDAVLERLMSSRIQRMVSEAVEEEAKPQEPLNILQVEDAPPEPSYPRDTSRVQFSMAHKGSPPMTDFLERESRNSSLGEAGEKFVISYEKARLIASGKDSLARGVEQISKTQGSAAGYDIRSYELDGKDRLIEVKTTRYGKETPFYVSKNELDTSSVHDKEYFLYRVFLFRADPHFFKLRGRIDKACRIDPIQFVARL